MKELLEIQRLNKELEKWKPLEKIGSPEKWKEMYSEYSNMLTIQDVSFWWNEEFMIANEERQELRNEVEELREILKGKDEEIKLFIKITELK